MQVAYCRGYFGQELELEQIQSELLLLRWYSALPCSQEPPKSTKYLAQLVLALVEQPDMSSQGLEAVIHRVLSTLQKFHK